MSTCNVLFAGRSLLLSAVAACLADEPGVRLTQLASASELDRFLSEDGIDVVVFDLSSLSDSNAFLALFQNPRLRLIGLDPEHSRALILAGSELPAPTMSQIRDLVTARIQPVPPQSPGEPA